MSLRNPKKSTNKDRIATTTTAWSIYIDDEYIGDIYSVYIEDVIIDMKKIYKDAHLHRRVNFNLYFHDIIYKREKILNKILNN